MWVGAHGGGGGVWDEQRSCDGDVERRAEEARREYSSMTSYTVKDVRAEDLQTEEFSHAELNALGIASSPVRRYCKRVIPAET